MKTIKKESKSIMQLIITAGAMCLAAVTIVEHGAYSWNEMWKWGLLVGLMLSGAWALMGGQDEDDSSRAE